MVSTGAVSPKPSQKLIREHRFAWIVSMASEIMTVSQLWNFNFQDDYLQKVGYPETGVGWPTGGDSPAVWVFIFLIIIGVANLLPVRLYGELEYFLGVLKITFIIGLIVINMMISALQLVPHGDHFWTWNKPYSFARNGFVLYVDSNNQPTSVLPGDAGRFVALWTAVTTVMFSLIGFETIALTGPENRDLEKYEAIKIASKKLTFRLTILYTLATFTVGLNVPYDDPYLAQAAWSSIHGGQNSAFVLACILNHIRGFPGFFNAVFIFSATTSGMNCLYNASRILHALASIPEAWPLWAHGWRKRLERTTSRGVPMATVTVSWLFGLLAFLAVTSDASQVSLRGLKFILLGTAIHQCTPGARAYVEKRNGLVDACLLGCLRILHSFLSSVSRLPLESTTTILASR